jgi:ubiquinone/menaquinone biosynthesis C-methylase UbiE
MSLSIQDRHRRYYRQARWTKSLRDYLFRKSDLNRARLVLEVGCGTGVLLAELDGSPPKQIHGLDIDLERIHLAARQASYALLTCGDAHRLPYATHALDVCFCHYLMLWVRDPAAVLAEMIRVTRPGGVVLILAEPDYGGRIDYPAALETLGEWQKSALSQQGANPEMGRRLAGLCASSGLVSVEVGVLGGEWKSLPDQEELTSEWSVYESDFENLGFGNAERAAWKHLLELDRAAWERGERVLFVPTFFAWGRVPD